MVIARAIMSVWAWVAMPGTTLATFLNAHRIVFKVVLGLFSSCNRAT